MEGSLGFIKNHFGLRSKAVWLDSTLRLIAEVREDVKQWEEKTVPVDWDRLPEWIDGAVESFRSQYKEIINLLTILGMETSDTYIDIDNPDAIHERDKRKPTCTRFTGYIRSKLGFSGQTRTLSYDSLFDSHNSTPKVESRKPVLDRADAVIRHRKMLQAIKEGGKLSCFRE